MDKEVFKGHIAALLSILIWGTTFISTKILLADFTPIEILFFRFLLGFLILTLVFPKRLGRKEPRQEGVFAAAGLCGICLYYLFENIALTYTMASNVGVIISISPFFTAMLSHIFMKTEEGRKTGFLIGFLVAMAGICLLSFNGAKLACNPLGDGLAVLAALLWAVYSLLTRKISSFGYHTIQTTRRTFAYGLLFMLPALLVFDCSLDIQRFAKPEALMHLLYLGIGASALCFVTWGCAVKVLGAVRTSIYIYMVPVITVITSAIVLKEKITGMTVLGTGLTLAGLFLSEGKFCVKKEEK